jgi:acyl-coenzyme A synthetase/AMP-(fatty) acid ligase
VPVGETDHVLLRDPPGGGEPLRYEIPDRLHWHDERHIEPLGRRDAVVQVGGENVDLEALRRRIVETVPGCTDCAVRLGENGRIRAFLVPARTETLTPEGVGSVLRERLAAAALPATISIGTELPRDATGKVTSW